jgi:hypothetical protein
MVKRLLWFQPGLDDPLTAHEFTSESRRPVKSERSSNLVSSLTDEGMHMPALDIDFPVTVKPSTTKGHYHLFIDKPMTWEQYMRLLEALTDAGIIEEGFYTASANRGASFLRTKQLKSAKNKINVLRGGY